MDDVFCRKTWVSGRSRNNAPLEGDNDARLVFPEAEATETHPRVRIDTIQNTDRARVLVRRERRAWEG